MNGSATASVLSPSAVPGRARMSANAARAAGPPVIRRATSSTAAAIATRDHTIIGALRSSSAYLISR